MDADEKRSRRETTARAALGLTFPLQTEGLTTANHLRLSASIRGQNPHPSNRGWTRMDADEKRSRLRTTTRAAVGLAFPLQTEGLTTANHLRLSASIRGQNPHPGPLPLVRLLFICGLLSPNLAKLFAPHDGLHRRAESIL